MRGPCLVPPAPPRAGPRAHLRVHLQQLHVQLLQLLGRQLLQDLVLVDVPVLLQLLPVGRHGWGLRGGLEGDRGGLSGRLPGQGSPRAVPSSHQTPHSHGAGACLAGGGTGAPQGGVQPSPAITTQLLGKLSHGPVLGAAPSSTAPTPLTPPFCTQCPPSPQGASRVACLGRGALHPLELPQLMGIYPLTRRSEAGGGTPGEAPGTHSRDLRTETCRKPGAPLGVGTLRAP